MVELKHRNKKPDWINDRDGIKSFIELTMFRFALVSNLISVLFPFSHVDETRIEGAFISVVNYFPHTLSPLNCAVGTGTHSMINLTIWSL